jgi:hypothetical protein
MSEECTICGAAYGSPSDLVVHVRHDHKNDDPALDVEMNPEAHTEGHPCSLCGERFANSVLLAHHNLIPHGAVPESRRRTSAPA